MPTPKDRNKILEKGDSTYRVEEYNGHPMLVLNPDGGMYGPNKRVALGLSKLKVLKKYDKKVAAFIKKYDK